MVLCSQLSEWLALGEEPDLHFLKLGGKQESPEDEQVGLMHVLSGFTNEVSGEQSTGFHFPAENTVEALGRSMTRSPCKVMQM